MDQLEADARRLVDGGSASREPDPIVDGVVREIAHILEQIDALRAIDERQLRSLLRGETYVDTELMQMEQRTPRYSPYRYPEREKLQRRLLTIERERRQTDRDSTKQLQELQSRLLTLMERHRTLTE